MGQPPLRQADRARSPYRRVAAAFGSSAVALLGCGLAACDRPPQPVVDNAIVLLVDTLRADRLGLYGYERPTDPNLQRLARSAVVFAGARSQASCTFPSVNSMLTSRLPDVFLAATREHGMAGPPHIPTVAEILQGRGFATAAVSASIVVRETPSRVNTLGGYGRGFDRFDESCAERRAPCVNQKARELLDDLAEPFFLYLHYMDPHAPYRTPSWHERRFVSSGSDKPWVRRGEPGPLLRRLYDGSEQGAWDDGDVQHLRDLYDEDVAFFDAQLAALFAELERRDLLARSVVFLVADHGEELMDHGHFAHCRDHVWDTVLHVPLVMWLPGAEARRVTGLVSNLDLAPTLLDTLGVSIAEQRFEGRSLLPLVRGDSDASPQVLAIQGRYRVLYAGRFKLVYDRRDGGSRLYDLRRDPGESVDIAAEHPELLATLEERLEARLLGETPGTDEGARELEEELRALGYL